MMRFTRSSTSITGRPKSKGREALDAVLFLGAAGVVSWSGFRNLDEGRILLRSGTDIRLAEQAGLFWGVLTIHILIVLLCLGLGLLAARALVRGLSNGGQKA